jgi:hypothetical protein
VVEWELDEMATCVDGYISKNGNAIIIPAELIR